MKKTLSLMVIMLLGLVSTAIAETLEIIYTANDSKGQTALLTGAFQKPLLFSPGDELASWYYSNWNNSSPFSFSKKYTYLGRTGDKTFEIELTDKKKSTLNRYSSAEERSKGGVIEEKTKMNMYLDTSEPFLLKALNSVFKLPETVKESYKCRTDDMVYLKLIGFKGNQLEAQILIPDCLRKEREK